LEKNMPAPSFENVPDSLKAPFGPYRQAPPEHGGRWYYVYPFNQTPWHTEPAVEDPGPEGFVELFGPPPNSNDFHHEENPSLAFRIARTKYEQDKKYFKQAGTPPNLDVDGLAAAQVTYEAWGMGEPKFYEGRYGWMAIFPDSQIPNYQSPVSQVVGFPHLVVPQYQMRLIEDGFELGDVHPFVPPHLLVSED
jgi:hypothetical protein